MTLPDDLIDRAVLGESDAREALAREYRPFALRTAHALLGDADVAEDVAQEAMIRFEKALPEFRRESDPGSWLYRITTNLALDHVRRARRSARAEVHPEGRAMEADPEGAIDRERAAIALREAVARLPAEYRAVLELRYLEGLSYEEIGRRTGAPGGTVASRLYRALERLASDIEPRHLEIIR